MWWHVGSCAFALSSVKVLHSDGVDVEVQALTITF